jgi:thioredoxin reductase (NADPH)
MSAPPNLSPERHAQLFPVLTPAQIERIRRLGRTRHVNAGDVLFKPGDRAVPFFVLLSGSMDIVQQVLHGERAVAIHDRPGQFTGEISMISGQPIMLLGRVTQPGDFVELDNEALRSIIAKDAELSEILLRAFILRRVELIQHGLGNVIVLGSRHSARTLELREFLSRNGYPHNYVDLDTDRESQELLDHFHIKPSEVPVVICNATDVLKNPTIQQLARCLGLNTRIDSGQIRDVIIAGAGPAGLAAAVYAASEGLDVLMIETHAPGGQAGSSSKIENYLGFPTGVSGAELAGRATTQALKFGANMLIARSVTRLDCTHRPYQLNLDCGDTLTCRSIIIATGAHYNKPDVENLQQFEGKGVYYGATKIESQNCAGDEVAVVGGGNSAGQAAVFLSQTAPMVHMLVRSGELRSTMSRYLIQRLADNPHIQLHFNTEIVKLEGADDLESVTWCDKTTGKLSTHPIPHVFIMTGASPCTDWLKDTLALDHKGFIVTGRDLESVTKPSLCWPLQRAPETLETSLPGVFAVGDVRSGNVKRVASAVGEGAIAVHMVHRVLADP